MDGAAVSGRSVMHYLQTYCGPPYNNSGPLWFKLGVILKVPIAAHGHLLTFPSN
jgi:hypothetical protein